MRSAAGPQLALRAEGSQFGGGGTVTPFSRARLNLIKGKRSLTGAAAQYAGQPAPAAEWELLSALRGRKERVGRSDPPFTRLSAPLQRETQST